MGVKLMEGVVAKVEASVKKIPFGSIYRHAEAFLELANRYAAQLSRCGWAAKQTAQLARETQRLRSLCSEQLIGRRTAVLSTKQVKAALREARVFRRRLMAALRLANSTGAIGIDLRPFHAAAMTRSAGGVLSWIARVRKSVLELDRTLQQGYLPESAVARLDGIERRLRDCIRVHEASVRKTPLQTQRVAQSRARIGLMIRQIALAAEVAFAEDATVLKEFRKRVPWLQRKEREELPAAA
jgi:hypothetical protein